MTRFIPIMLVTALLSLSVVNDVHARRAKSGQTWIDGRRVPVLGPRTQAPVGGYSLIISLHWAGARGASYLPIFQNFTKTQPTIFAFPTAIGTRWHSSDRRHVYNVVRYLRTQYRIDPARIYLVGFSRGGSFAYDYGLRQGSPFTAIAPIAAGWVHLPKNSRRDVAICAIHGQSDRLVRPRRTRKMIDELRRRGFSVSGWTVPGMGHRHKTRINRELWRCLDRRYQRTQRMLQRYARKII